MKQERDGTYFHDVRERCIFMCSLFFMVEVQNCSTIIYLANEVPCYFWENTKRGARTAMGCTLY